MQINRHKCRGGGDPDVSSFPHTFAYALYIMPVPTEVVASPSPSTQPAFPALDHFRVKNIPPAAY
jgi:hypothetical protein